MKSSITIALALLSTTAWMAGGAHAQTYPSTSSPYAQDGGPYSPEIQRVAYSAEPTGGSDAAVWSESSEKTSGNGQFDEALHGPCGDGCEICDECAPKRKWFAAFLGLAMTRNRAPANWLTHTTGDPFDLRMNSEDAKANWTGGGQVTCGYAWNGVGGPAVAFTYWGIAPMTGAGSVSDTSGNPATALDSTINFSAVTINGNPGSLYFDNSQQQAVWRRDRADSLELNLTSDTYTIGSFKVAGLVGFRYFRFADNLTYGAASFGNSFSSNGGADAAYLSFQSLNSLYGGQLGSVMTSTLTSRWTAFAIPKVGLYGNKMTVVNELYSGNSALPPVTHFIANKTDASALAELDLGLNWAFSQNWGLTMGYRLVSVTNVALADNQFASYFHVAQGGSLIMHGALMGLTWAF